ncbi:polysaccharide biosynthesis protein [Parvibacter caecicola]|uniref:Polysaccharide biosynthesis protein n=1 Tax=Parvibacter caecicola TaxID=747645 RepID=A0A4T9TEW0_9ACTN|nr:nucleoside-diphosphate sugar epimerase/dehydratase [Parvibacter caecicola]TJW11347.1 polysaccharide biosynthesis protein [Parvibacter caecicola]
MATVPGRGYFVQALPLFIIDILGTLAAFLIAAWSTNTSELVIETHHFGWHLALLAAVNVIVFALFRMYNNMWRYASVDDAGRIILATLVGSLVGDILGALVFGNRLPFRVYICEWAILFVIVAMARFLIRINAGKRSWSFLGVQETGLPRTLIVGAGESGSLVVNRMLAGSDDIPGCPICFVDDDSAKVGRRIHGIPVDGTCDDIPHVCERRGIEQIVVAVPAATRKEKKRIFDLCIESGCKVLTVPDRIKDTPADQLGRAVLRDVEVPDLLAREEVMLDAALVGDYLNGKTVLVTGGGGSIGSELARQLLPAKPAKIVLFDIYENTVYELYHEISGKAREAGIQVVTEIGSITHMPALREVFERHRPHVIFHAAAHKHVPLMEFNPREAIENNVFGTQNVVDMADEFGCSHFILISTDKAVNPTNVMGATKRMCEMIIQKKAEESNTVFAAVRFGNVLGSHGSVIPLFKRQLKEGGPLTVTHQDITRYFMTIPEASRLVITAGALAEGGEIFVLDMGEPVRIYDLAENLIRLSGLTVGEDIEIKVTGLRPGEKLYEELSMGDEPTKPTANGSITVICGVRPEVQTVNERLDLLAGALSEDVPQLKQKLAEAVPTYHPQNNA